MADHHAKVLRDGDWLTVPATELVPGDIVSVKTGTLSKPTFAQLHVAELKPTAHLTGEAEPVQTNPHWALTCKSVTTPTWAFLVRQ